MGFCVQDFACSLVYVRVAMSNVFMSLHMCVRVHPSDKHWWYGWRDEADGEGWRVRVEGG